MKPEKPIHNSKEIELMPSEVDTTLAQKEDENSFLWKLKKIMNPPIYATVVAIPLALIPYMKEYVFAGSGAILTHNLFAAMTKVGSCVSPILNLMLGSNLSRGYPPEADIKS